MAGLGINVWPEQLAGRARVGIRTLQALFVISVLVVLHKVCAERALSSYFYWGWIGLSFAASLLVMADMARRGAFQETRESL